MYSNARPSLLSRRQLLFGMLGLMGSLSGCTGDDDSTDWDEQFDRWGEEYAAGEAEWEARANERISNHRIGGLEITVHDDGEPIGDAEVSVTMQTHAYGFGTAVNASYFQEETDEDHPYREKLRNLFNTAVFENYHKWGPWEDEANRSQAESTHDWLLDQGLTVRGHTCIWQTTDFGYYQYPDDVIDAIEERDGQHLRERSIGHVDTIVDTYAGTVSGWDVVNEQLDHSGLTDIVDPEPPRTEKPILVDWYETAHAADPDATLYLNEFDIINGFNPGKEWQYVDLVEFLLKAGATLDGIGMQGHHFREPVQTPEKILEVCNVLADVGDVELAVTEYDTPGLEETAAAEYLQRFLKTFFSHPATSQFLMWGFWDGTHWADDAPLFDRDWEPKPAYAVYTDLVFDEWWTDVDGLTDADGRFDIVAFLGEHTVEVTAGGVSKARTVTLERAREVRRVDVNLSD